MGNKNTSHKRKRSDSAGSSDSDAEDFDFAQIEADGMSKLADAIEMQDVEAVKAILAQPGAEMLLNTPMPNSRLSEPPLLYAIHVTGSLEIAKVFVEHGANVRQVNKDSANAAHVACWNNNVPLVKYFVEKLGLECKDDTGNTPLVHAATHGHIDVVEYLLSEGADVNVCSDEQRITPLMVCARRGDTKMVERLIAKGVNVDAVDKWGRSALFYCSRAGTLPTMKLLVERGRTNVNLRDRLGHDAFWVAESRAMYECALYLFSHGADCPPLVKSRGFGANVKFSRPYLAGAIPTARKAPVAFTTLHGGKRIVMFGGYGVEPGLKQSNNLDSLDTSNLKTNHLCDIYYADLDQTTEELPFISDQFNEYRLKIHPEASKGHWSKKNKSHRISIESDGLTCEFTGTFDPACIQADISFDGSQTSCMAYYEITVLSLGSHGMVTMGMTNAKYDVNAHPGWYPESFALHGDDGQVFLNVGAGNIWGPRFNEGDVIGCGVNFATEEIWFTRNGKFLGVAFRGFDQLRKHKWFPTVGMSSPGEKVKANFGAVPFVFNFEAPILTFHTPSLKLKGSMDVFNSKKQSLPQMIWPQFFRFDEEDTILLVGVDRISALPLVRLIHCKTWEVSENAIQGQNRDFDSHAWSSVFHFDESEKLLYCGALCALEPSAGPWTVYIRRLDCKSWTWDEDRLLSLNYTYDMLECGIASEAPHVLLIWRGFLWLWHPLGSKGLRVPLNGKSRTWEDVAFEGALCRETHYSLTVQKDALFAFAGWDDNSQSNSFHMIELEERLTGEKDEEGLPITRPVMTWSRPHRDGTVPRPRNDVGLFSVDENTLAAVAGWNGRNYVNDFELVTLEQEIQRDPLRKLLQGDELSDFCINLKDGESLKTTKVILYARSSYFREFFKSNPNADQVDLSSIPRSLFYPLLYYLHTDVVETESIDKGIVRVFLDGVVNRFAPEHLNRISQFLFAATIATVSSLGRDLGEHAWNNPLFQDVEFEIPASETSPARRFPAHRAIVCSRSRFFHGLCMGGLKESRERVISIPEASPEAFGAVLNYLYSSSVDFEAVEPYIIDLLMAASLYDVDGLRSLLEGVIAQSLTLENVVSLFITADQVQASKLRDACAKMIKSNYKAISAQPDFAADKSMVDELLKNAQ